jgi:aryl-alcohol dehydrogenase-like predicted oxidoreductase
MQAEYNLYSREKYEKEYETICTEHGLGVIPYFALASGFLSGKYRSEGDAAKSIRGSTIVEKYLNPRGFRILQALDEVAHRYSTSLTSVALAWLMARPSISAPIASATSKEQLAELVKAVHLSLWKDEASLQQLNEASSYD